MHENKRLVSKVLAHITWVRIRETMQLVNLLGALSKHDNSDDDDGDDNELLDKHALKQLAGPLVSKTAGLGVKGLGQKRKASELTAAGAAKPADTVAHGRVGSACE